MRALVTGGSGFLGRYVCEELQARGFDVVAPKSAAFDLRESRHVRDMFWALGRIDVIVHCAARVGGIGANVEAPGDFYRDNIVMGVNLMDAALHSDVKKMLTIGTACMYPEFSPMPQREDNLYLGKPVAETAPYAFAKRGIMEMGQAYRKQYDFNAVFVIPTNLYGPRDSFDPKHGHVIPSMIKKFMDGGDVVTLWGTGKPTRDFLYVEDAARGITDVLESYDAPAPINLGSGYAVSIAHLAEDIAKATGFKGKVVWDTDKPDGAPYRQLAIDRAQTVLGWGPTTLLMEGLEKTIAWYQEARG
jgi:GDP-L-fucose synthase